MLFVSLRGVNFFGKFGLARVSRDLDLVESKNELVQSFSQLL